MPILVVDDDQDTRLALAEYLGLRGFKTLAAGSGAEAVALANEHHPRVIVLDLVMPGMTGLQVIAVLKASAETRTIPILCLTGLSDSHGKLRAGGCEHYMLKPAQPGELVKKIERLLRRTPPPV